ncbi:hypothetical protein E2562_016435 [Oryza meyeriana var. granulata]|uniref:F-box domain-containing protein n=1 Tax=Oryza meyeriana var. granulata TaxID=110450 RepID=A0A6G1EX01_9ORYZ|nr:hypothetical protein E2562_016435 [Oryza meyeriana var. granulata]
MDTAPTHGPNTDMLSGLPEGVLHRIMSFLTLRQAVQTCVLSHRWRNLWRSMPHINADYKQFMVMGMVVTQAGDEALVLFKRFVNRLLELRDPVASMDKFCLWYLISDDKDDDTDSQDDDNDDDTDSQDAVANRWIGHALQKQARVVEVDVELVYADLKPLVLDHSVFTSCHLTKILFCNVILGDGFFKQLKTGCPALEDLSLDLCIISDDEISSQTLKVLTITGTKFSMEHRTSISTPSVTSLTLWSPDGMVVLKDIASVVTASVKLTNDLVSDGSDARGLRQYLWTLSGVKNLEFHYLVTNLDMKLTIKSNLQLCPKFNNLVNLTLGQWCLDANFYALIVFMQNSPRLEKLTLKLDPFRHQTSQRIIGELNERSFTCGHLKIVEVQCSENDPRANHVVNFFVSTGMTSAQIHIKH